MIEIIKRHLENQTVGSHFHFGLSDDDFRRLAELLEGDYGLEEVIVDFDDLDRLDAILASIPENLNRSLLVYYVYEQYLYYKILSQIDIPSSIDLDIKKTEDVLFGGDFERFTKLEWVFLADLDEIITKFNNENKRRIRLHLMLDGVEDTILQMVINSIVAPRFSMVIMGYTSRVSLITYQLMSEGRDLELTAEYFAYGKDSQKMLDFSPKQD